MEKEGYVMDLIDDNGESSAFTGRKRKPGHLWQHLFAIVLAPFIFLAIPSHLLITKTGNSQAISTVSWIKSVFKPSYVSPFILTSITAITTLIAGAFILYWIFIIFYSLVILGEVNFDILDATYNLIQSIPVFIPTLCIWMFGYGLKKTLLGFDTTQFELEKLIETCSSERRRPPDSFSSKSLVIQAFGLYFLIAAIVIVTMVLDFARFRFPESTPYYMDLDYWHGLWVLLAYNCVLATYCMICWGLQCQLQLFSYYLTYLANDGKGPTFQILAEVKFYFKKCGTQILLVNSGFSVLVSAVVVILLCFVIMDTIFVVFYAIPSSVTIAITIIEKYLKHFGVEIDIVSPWERYNHQGHIYVEDENGTTLPPHILEKYGPVFVRKTVAHFFLVGAQTGLIFFVGLQANAVNRMMRYFSVQFNDYMSSHAGSISLDLYHEFRTVRFYILSALSLQENWIILRLPVMNFIPFIKNKIHLTGPT